MRWKVNIYARVYFTHSDENLPNILYIKTTCPIDADVVLIPAGMPRKPGMTRDDLFSSNASILRDIAIDFGKYAPEKAIMAIITNPVNSMVPIATEVLKKVWEIIFLIIIIFIQ